MKPSRIEQMIDNKILEHLGKGRTLVDIYYILEDNINKFSNRENYIDVSKGYILSNWENIGSRERATTYYVIFSKERKSDIMWLLMKGQAKFDFTLDSTKLFKLLKLKEKLQPNDSKNKLSL